MSLLKKNSTKKEKVNKKVIKLEFEAVNNSNKYKVKTIWDSTVYVNNTESHLPSLYYLVA